MFSRLLDILHKFYLKTKIKSKNKYVLYKIEEIYRKDWQQMVVIKIIGDPKGRFIMPASKLVTKRKDLLDGFDLNDILSIIALAISEKTPQMVEIRRAPYKFYCVLAMLFGTVLVISNILSSKLISVAGYTMTGGQIIFPLSYILGDILTEVYGYKRSRLLIWGSITCNLIFVFFAEIVIYLDPSPYYHLNHEFGIIIGSVPRIIVASLIGYVIGEFSNALILSKLKISMKGQYLWKRLFGSSAVAIALASCAFTYLAFIGNIPNTEIMYLMLKVYVACIIYEIISLPFSVYLINKIKVAEEIDIYDFDINYSPFSLDVSYDESHNLYSKNKDHLIHTV